MAKVIYFVALIGITLLYSITEATLQVCEDKVKELKANFTCSGCNPDPFPAEGLIPECGPQGSSSSSNCTNACQAQIDDVFTACSSFDEDVNFPENLGTSLGATIFGVAAGERNIGVCDFRYDFTTCDVEVDNFKDFVFDNDECNKFGTTSGPCADKCNNRVSTLLSRCKNKELIIPETSSDRDVIIGQKMTFNASRSGIQDILFDNYMNAECYNAAIKIVAGDIVGSTGEVPEDKGLATEAVVGIVVGVLLIASVAGFIFYKRRTA